MPCGYPQHPISRSTEEEILYETEDAFRSSVGVPWRTPADCQWVHERANRALWFRFGHVHGNRGRQERERTADCQGRCSVVSKERTQTNRLLEEGLQTFSVHSYR